MKVFSTREIDSEGVYLIEKEGYSVDFWNRGPVPTSAELIEVCKDYDALIVADVNKIDEVFLRASPHLKVIALHSIGHNHVQLKIAKELGIPVGNTPKAGSKETADTAFMLMLNVAKNSFYMHQQIRKGAWKHFEPIQNLGIYLRGKKLGIFGLGEVGFEMARLSQVSYGMSILYHNRNKNEKAERELGATWVTFEELLTESDVISVHSNLNKNTLNKFDATAFSKMKSTAIFINTARGLIHDEVALQLALECKQLFGAGLDVTNPEPMLPDNVLLDLPYVAITPHIGSAIDVARREMSIMVARNVIAGLKGEELPFAL